MAKFLFKMNSILELKEKLEDQEKISYGNARRKLTEEENKLDALKQKKLMYEDLYRTLLSKRLNLREIQNIQAAIENSKDKIKSQMNEVRNAQKGLEIARVKLNKAMTERKTYETLKDKAFEQFKKDIEAAEQKEIDELVSFKFNGGGEET